MQFGVPTYSECALLSQDPKRYLCPVCINVSSYSQTHLPSFGILSLTVVISALVGCAYLCVLWQVKDFWCSEQQEIHATSAALHFLLNGYSWGLIFPQLPIKCKACIKTLSFTTVNSCKALWVWWSNLQPAGDLHMPATLCWIPPSPRMERKTLQFYKLA